MLTVLSSLLSKSVSGPGDLSGWFSINWGSIWNVGLLEANDPLPHSELNDTSGFVDNPFVSWSLRFILYFGSVCGLVCFHSRAEVISWHFRSIHSVFIHHIHFPLILHINISSNSSALRDHFCLVGM